MTDRGPSHAKRMVCYSPVGTSVVVPCDCVMSQTASIFTHPSSGKFDFLRCLWYTLK